MKRAFIVMSTVLLGLVVVACGSDARFEAKYATEYARGGSLSFFGVFKDGRMNPELSAQLGPSIIRKGKCDAAYSVDFVALKGAAANAVDDYIRQNGVTDTLLAEFAASAKGDAILVVSMSGHVGPRSAPLSTTTTTRQNPMPGSTRRMPTQQYEVAPGPANQNVLEMSASLYSVRLKKSVALLSMIYDGPSADMAITKFGDRLAEEMQPSSCGGWNADIAIDEAKIKALKEE